MSAPLPCPRARALTEGFRCCRFGFPELAEPLAESLETFRKLTKDRQDRRNEAARKRKAEQEPPRGDAEAEEADTEDAGADNTGPEVDEGAAGGSEVDAGDMPERELEAGAAAGARAGVGAETGAGTLEAGPRVGEGGAIEGLPKV